MLKGIEVLCHSSIRIEKERIIYIDPFRIEKDYNDADIIFVTHSHYDHFSPEDIKMVKSFNTIIVVTEDLLEKAIQIGFKKEKIITVKPSQRGEIIGINFMTIPAYNVNKQFHQKQNNWVGYILEIDGINYYIAGDTDITEEAKNVNCDVAFVPVGGTYTMTSQEAAELVNIIKPQIAIPIHYGEIVGNNQDAEMFSKLLSNEIKCRILI